MSSFHPPHPEAEAMTSKELRAAIAEAEEKLRLARSIEDKGERGLTEAQFVQEIRRLEAALARRTGTAPKDGDQTAISRRVSSIEREEVEWLWLGRVPIGKLTLFG